MPLVETFRIRWVDAEGIKHVSQKMDDVALVVSQALRHTRELSSYCWVEKWDVDTYTWVLAFDFWDDCRRFAEVFFFEWDRPYLERTAVLWNKLCP